uniref:hypothetical protein n=1 Tax=Aquisalimonas sp. TaxID=1872621 RepID=UPI0025C6D429
MSSELPKTLYLDTAVADVAVDGRALRVDVPGKASEFVPVRRVGRAVVRGSESGLLDACLEIVARGGTVHFESAGGRMLAVLQNATPAKTREAMELAAAIDASDGSAAYAWWRDSQRRHAWSLVFRRGFLGEFEGARRRFMKYLVRLAPGVPVEREWAYLEGRLLAWIQAEVNRQGLEPAILIMALKPGPLGRWRAGDRGRSAWERHCGDDGHGPVGH